MLGIGTSGSRTCVVVRGNKRCLDDLRPGLLWSTLWVLESEAEEHSIAVVCQSQWCASKAGSCAIACVRLIEEAWVVFQITWKRNVIIWTDIGGKLLLLGVSQ